MEKIYLKIKFIKEFINKDIDIINEDDNVIYKQLEEREYPIIDNDEKYDYLLNMNVRRFSKQELEKLIKEIKNIIATIEKLEKMDIKNIWRLELQELENKI